MPTRSPTDERVYATATLKAVLDTMSRQQVVDTFHCFDHWCDVWRRVNVKAEPQDVAYTVHSIVDEHMIHLLKTSPQRDSVSCRKGCTNCCSQYVGIFPQEAHLLRMVAAEAGIEIDEARLARQAEKTEATWCELSPEDRRCVFLGEDRACRVYEHRPSSCRKYLVNTDPALCHVEHKGNVGVVFSINAEIVQSAAMTSYGSGNDNIAAVLLAVAKEEA